MLIKGLERIKVKRTVACVGRMGIGQEREMADHGEHTQQLYSMEGCGKVCVKKKKKKNYTQPSCL